MSGVLYNLTHPPPPSAAYGPSATCDLPTCAVEWSVYSYRPSLVGNVVFVVLFLISGGVHIYQGVFLHRTWFFSGAVVGGCLCEVIGYSGRVVLWRNPFDFQGFLIQIGW